MRSHLLKLFDPLPLFCMLIFLCPNTGKHEPEARTPPGLLLYSIYYSCSVASYQIFQRPCRKDCGLVQ